MENNKIKPAFIAISEDGKSFKAYNEKAFLARFEGENKERFSLRKPTPELWQELGIPMLEGGR